MKTTEIIYKLREAADILRSIPNEDCLVGTEDFIDEAITAIENAIEEEEERWYCDVDCSFQDGENLRLVDKFAKPCEKFKPREE